MGKRPFRANYSQMVPAPSGAGWPCHLAFPEDGKPSKGWRRGRRARSLVRLCIGSRLPRATASFTIIYDIAADLFSPYGSGGCAASHARAMVDIQGLARNWASTQPLTPTTPGLSDAGFCVSSQQPSAYCRGGAHATWRAAMTQSLPTLTHVWTACPSTGGVALVITWLP